MSPSSEAALNHNIRISEFQSIATSVCLSFVLVISYDYGKNGGNGFATFIVCSAILFLLLLVRAVGRSWSSLSKSTSLVARKHDHTDAIASVGIFAVGVANLLESAFHKHECGYYIDNHGHLRSKQPHHCQRTTIDGCMTEWITRNLKYGSCNVQRLHVGHYGNWHGYIA
ncbi:hypothetical protein NHJ13051_003803, partial [Beauveria bassiana]